MRLQRALEEELERHFVDVVVRGIASLELPAAFALEGIEERQNHCRLTDVLICELSAELAEPVRWLVALFEGELRLGSCNSGASGREVSVQFLDRGLLDRADDGDERRVERHVHNQVLSLGGHG